MRALAAIIAMIALANDALAAAPIWLKFCGEKAFAQVKALVDLGPRPAGSAALEKSRVLIEKELQRAGWKVTRQTFTDQTPRGAMTFSNIIATFGDKAQPSFLLCSHYDTKTFDTISFVGANDGGSSTGLLMEIARVLPSEPSLAAKVELVFFDGEEAFENFTATDGLFGSRHFAQSLGAEVKQFRGGILFDMIGDKSLTVTLSPDSPPDLTLRIFASASALGQRAHFTFFQSEITDDHTPLNAIGIPVIDLIDFDYPPWHTAGDTLDKLSAESLQIVGQVALHAVAQTLAP